MKLYRYVVPTSLLFQLLSSLCEDPLACEAQLSLFCAAAESYKHDSLLRPFPPQFLRDGGGGGGGGEERRKGQERDIEQLVGRFQEERFSF